MMNDQNIDETLSVDPEAHATPNFNIDLFPLRRLGFVKIGGFDSAGNPAGWDYDDLQVWHTNRHEAGITIEHLPQGGYQVTKREGHPAPIAVIDDQVLIFGHYSRRLTALRCATVVK